MRRKSVLDEYYTSYKNGAPLGTCAEIARAYGISRQSVLAFFQRRGVVLPLTHPWKAKVIDELRAGGDVREIAAKYGLSRHTVYKYSAKVRQQYKGRILIMLEGGYDVHTIAAKLGCTEPYVYQVRAEAKKIS